MKIGVITFWDSQENYGQVLQTYALQVFLKRKGHESFLIRYDKSTSVKKKKPSLAKKILNTNWDKLFDKQALKRKLDSFSADLDGTPDREFDTFKKEHLKLSAEFYSSPEALQNNPPDADVYICGSDQVWNYKFIGDYKPFFLQFGDPQVQRIAYAASFGHKELPSEVKSEYQEYLKSFDAISVRESSGMELCRQMGYESRLLPDPTALLNRRAWEALSKRTDDFALSNKRKVFIYTLGNRPSTAREDLFRHFTESPETVVAHTSIHKDREGDLHPSIQEWLGYFRDCDLVLTNSFHGMLFSIIFNKNFIGLPCTGNNAGMNERLTTLMEGLGLEDHLLFEFDINKVNELTQKKVDWESINAKIDKWRMQAHDFLDVIKANAGSIAS